jgi:hypothetical protein
MLLGGRRERRIPEKKESKQKRQKMGFCDDAEAGARFNPMDINCILSLYIKNASRHEWRERERVTMYSKSSYILEKKRVFRPSRIVFEVENLKHGATIYREE